MMLRYNPDVMSSASVTATQAEQEHHKAIRQRLKPPPSRADIEYLLKAAGIFIATTYSIGFVVTNQYLLSLGVIDFTFVRPRYIVTGTWCLLLLAAAAWPIAAENAVVQRRELESQLNGLEQYSEEEKAVHWRNLWTMFAGGVVVSILSTYTTLILLGARPWPPMLRELFWLLVLVYFVAGVGGLLWQLIWRVQGTRLIGTVGIAVLLPAALLGLTNKVLVRVYEKVPESLGGGRPVTGVLLFNKEGCAAWKESGATLLSNEVMNSGIVKIMYQNDQEVVVRAPYKLGQQMKEKIIILDKKLVIGVVP